MKKIILIVLVLSAIYGLSTYKPQVSRTSDTQATVSETTAGQARTEGSGRSGSVDIAYAHRLEDVRVEDQGSVVKVLADDTQGSRHQRFLVRMNSGTTVLIAHNIDLAPRLTNLQAGDRVRFAGDYVWNEKGGVVHWTHRDPSGRHQAGWIELKGQMYR